LQGSTIVPACLGQFKRGAQINIKMGNMLSFFFKAYLYV
jgi:hypothetical protein